MEARNFIMNHLFRLRKIYKKLALWLLIFIFSTEPLLVAAAATTQVTTDASQGKNPGVTQAANGTTVVNILAPNAKGLSYNQYVNLQVGAGGLIFNNKFGLSQTQLAGYIAGNPNLANGSARIILNEVTGKLPTNLNGYMEVAGQKADFILANPNGIVGNNLGFINASRGVLTTGTPVIGSDGNLEAFRVQEGQIVVEGTGINSTDSDRVDLIARAVKINAGIWAKDLNITTGTNEVTYANNQVTALTPASTADAVGVALDVASLGGMYANKITLVGTQAGVGVNSQGTIAASSGDLILTQEGKVILGGNTSASGNLQIATKDTFTQNGVTYAKGNTNMNAANITNSGVIAAAQNISMVAKKVTSTGTIGAGVQENGELGKTGNLTVIAGTTVTATGKNLAGGNIDISGKNIDLQGASTYAGGQGNLNALSGDINNTGGILQTDGVLTVNATGTVKNDKNSSGTAGQIISNQVTVKAASVSNQGSTITQTGMSNTTMTVSGNLDNTNGTIASNGAMALNVGKLTNKGGTIQTSGTESADLSIVANGSQINNIEGIIDSIHGKTKIIASAGSLDNTKGRIEAAQVVDISAVGLNNTDGIVDGESLNANSQTKALDNTSGKLVATGGAVNIQSGALNNEAGLIQSTGDIVINTHSQNLNNTHSGANSGIVGKGAVNLLTGDLNNQSGYIGSGGMLTTQSAAIDNTQGGILTSTAQMGIEAKDLNNQNGQIQSEGNVAIQLSGTLNNTGSIVRAGQTLTVKSDIIKNTNTQGDNQGLEGKSVNLTASKIDNQQGAVRADDALNINSNHNINNTQGLVSSGKKLDLQDANLATKALIITNTGGTLIAGEQLKVNSSSLSGDGKVLSKGDISVKLTKNYTNNGDLQANGNLSLETAGTFTNQADLLAGNTLDIHANQITNTASSTISAQATKVTATDVLTNRGLIDGSQTLVKAGTLNNLGAGRIYGDHLAIQANTLNNGVENGVAPVIAARERLDIGAQNIVNSEHSLIFSAGDMAIGGSLDTDSKAVGQAISLQNNSATIESLGSLNLAAKTINNTNEHFSTTIETTKIEDVVEYQGSGSPNRYKPDSPGVEIFNQESDFLRTPESAYENWTAYRYKQTTTESKILTSDPAKILSGTTMQIYADTLTNDKSRIIAGSKLTGNIGNLNNIEAQGERTITSSGTATSYWRNRRKGRDTTGSNATSYDPAATIEHFALNSTAYQENTAATDTGMQVGKTSTSKINNSITGAATTDVTLHDGAYISPITKVTNLTGDGVILSGGVNTRVPNSSLFSTTPNSSANYLVETDPRFANYKNWVSSDYMLKTLDYDPSVVQKRLGDGFYEQMMVRDQITKLTGKRFLNGYTSDEAQYQTLMDNAVTFAKENQLTIGKELSADQMAKMTSDMVWLVEKEVLLPNGQITHALVPQVYVKSSKDSATSSADALISGDNIQLDISGDLKNSGTIKASNETKITAENINNLGGSISGNDVNLQARTDINNIGGQIKAVDSLTAAAGHDLNVTTTISTQTSKQGQRTNIDNVAGLYVTGDKGTLTANAGNDINLTAAQITNDGKDGTTTIDAKNNLNLGTVKESESNKIVWDSNNKRNDSAITDVGTTIQAKGDITLKAGKDLNAKAATVESDKNLEVKADRDINITTGEAYTDVDEAHKHKGHSGSGLSSVTISTRDTLAQTTTLATTLSGDSTTVKSGQNLTIKGSNVIATNDVNITAKGNIAITTAEETQDEEHMKQEKKSGLLSGGGFGFTVGTETQKRTVTGQNVNQASSTIGSTKGNVTIESGKDTQITGSEIISEKDTKITGRNVTIEAAQETFQDKQTYEYKKSGLSVSLSSPAIDTISTVANKIERAKKVSDGRLADLYEISALRDIKGLDKKIDNTVNGQVIGKDKDGNVQRASRDISLNVSLGSTSYNENSTSQGTQAKSSQIVAGKNLEITATGGEEKEKEGNVSIIGSTLNGDNVTIKANKDVTIKSAENTTTNQTNSSGKTSGVGAQISTSGVGFYVEGSKSKGIENGTIVTHTQSVVTAGDTLQITSEKDTKVIGAKIQGETVKMDVTNNLNIASEQDIDNYDSKNTSAGGKIGTGGMGTKLSANQGKINSTYESVTEQTEIHAGKGGFNIEVGKNTDLKGAVISSDATPDKNKISTDTLTYSNIANKADYSASSTGISYSAGSGVEKKDKGLTPNIGTPAKGDASSTTKSAVADGTIEVRSNPNQDLSGLSRDTTNSLNALGKIFDKQTVEERQELVGLFGQLAFEEIHKLSIDKGWKDGDPQKVALHTLIGGIMSELAGSGFSAGAEGAGFNEAIQKQLSNITDPALRQWASYIISSAVTGTVGGIAGLYGTKYNDLNAFSLEFYNLMFKALGYTIAIYEGVQVVTNKAGEVVASWSPDVGGWVDSAGNWLADSWDSLILWAKGEKVNPPGVSQGTAQAPKEGAANSEYEKVDNENPEIVVSKTKYNENGKPAEREDYYRGSNPHTHYDKTTGKELTNHKHVYRYNDKGQRIGEDVEPLE